jgi:protein O-mannosyl-transferase
MAKRSKNKKAFRPAEPPKPASISWKVAIQIAVMIAAGFCIYWPTLRGDWLWDDDILVTGNASLRSFHGLGQIWFSAPATDYWPLTWTLLWIEWQLWGNAPFGYHLCSVALHLGSGFLIWRLFGRLGMRAGWFGGLLFIIHPLAVESVAWISEIKNTLSLPFFLLACDAWLDTEENKPTGYFRSVLYYLAAMLAKTSTVMLPAVLLLYCWWKRGRVSPQEIKRMIPYAAISLVLGLVTVYFQNHRHDDFPVVLGSFVARSIGAGTDVFFYLGKFILPVALLPIYPRWTQDPSSFLQVLTVPALAVFLLGCWTQREGWGRHVLFGFGFFLLNLLPVLGLVKMQYLSITWVADHLVYLPMVGLIGLVAAGAELAYRKVPAPVRFCGGGAIAIAMVGLVWESHAYASLFVDQETLWTYTLQHNPMAAPADTNLGIVYLQKGEVGAAIERFEEALKINRDDAEAHYNLGLAWAKMGRLAVAIEQYEEALRIKPDYAKAHYNLGNALMKLGRTAEAMDQYEQALKINPNYAGAYNNLGAALLQAGRASEAAEQYERALEIEPGLVDAHFNLGTALMQAGRRSEAVVQFEQVLQMNPDDAEARANLSKLQTVQDVGSRPR